MTARPEAPGVLPPSPALDAVCALAAAKAAASLSRLAGSPLDVDRVEAVRLAPERLLELAGGAESPAVGVLVPFSGDRDGVLLVLWSEADAARLALALGGPGEESALLEGAGAALAGAVVDAASRLGQRVLVTLPPRHAREMAGALLDGVLSGAEEDLVLGLRVRGPGGGDLGRALVVPDEGAAALLAEAAGRPSGP